MSTRIQQAQLITDPSFLLQVQGGLYAAAAAVLNEADTTANHTNRIAWARAIFSDAPAQAKFLAPGFLTNATVAGAAGNPAGSSGSPIADSDVDFVIGSLFDNYASAYVNGQPPTL